ncbi:MAG TPA: hypothetical protein VGL40_10405 [Bacillota bacterium]
MLQGSDRIGPVEYRDYRVQYRLGSAPLVSLDQATWFDPSSSEIHRNPVKWLSDEVALIPLMNSPSEYLKLNTLNLGTGAITDLQVPLTKVFAFSVSPDRTKIAIRGARENPDWVTLNVLTYDLASKSFTEVYQCSPAGTGNPMDGLSWRFNDELYFDVAEGTVPAVMRWLAKEQRVETFLRQALNPQVSPSGDLIAYLSAPSVYGDPAPEGIMVKSFDGAIEQKIPGAIGRITWSDDSGTVAVSLQSTVWEHSVKPLPSGTTQEMALPASVSRAEFRAGKLHLHVWKIVDGDIVGTDEIVK